MGSMTKVMQKIQGQDAAGDLPPTEPASPGSLSDATFNPPPVVEGVNEPEATSAFVPTDSSNAVAEPRNPSRARQEAEGPSRARQEAESESQVWDARRVDRVIVAFHDRYSAVCEQYRAVRARLLTMNATQVPQVIALTSAIPEEGKSVSALNLSLVMAEGGEHRILIADADFRRTSIARMLGVADHPGLADVLRGEVELAQALQATPFPNLKLLPAGLVRDHAYADLFGRPAAKGVIEQLRATFDYTFIDTPPITTVSDVCLLAPHCDGVIVVIEMRRTPEPTVQQAIRTLQANNVKILGALLSRFRDGGSGYYDYYSSEYYR